MLDWVSNFSRIDISTMIKHFAILILLTLAFGVFGQIPIAQDLSITDYCITPGQTHVAVACKNEVSFFDLSEGMEAGKFAVGSESIYKIALMNDSSSVIVATENGLVLSINLQSYIGDTIFASGHSFTEMFLLEDSMLLLCNTKYQLLAIDLRGDLIFMYKFSDFVSALTYDPDHAMIYAGDMSGMIHAMNLDGQVLWSKKLNNSCFDLSYNRFDKGLYVAAPKIIFKIPMDKPDSFTQVEFLFPISWPLAIDFSSEISRVIAKSSGSLTVQFSYGKYVHTHHSSIVSASRVKRDREQVQVVFLDLNNQLYSVKTDQMRFYPYSR